MVIEQGIDAPEVLAFSQVVDNAILEFYKDILIIGISEKCEKEGQILKSYIKDK